MDFDWDFANLEHIARHKVEQAEAEETLTDPAALKTSAYRGPNGQPRFGFIGATEEGRVLVVYHELRGEKIRVVTVRPATPEERALYLSEE